MYSSLKRREHQKAILFFELFLHSLLCISHYSFFQFIKILIEYLYVPGTILNTQHTAMNKTEKKFSVQKEFMFYGVEADKWQDKLVKYVVYSTRC